MRWSTTSVLVIACSVVPAGVSLAQLADLDPFVEYEEFLAQHRDMSPFELLAMHPAGDFQEGVGQPWESVLHHELIDAR